MSRVLICVGILVFCVFLLEVKASNNSSAANTTCLVNGSWVNVTINGTDCANSTLPSTTVAGSTTVGAVTNSPPGATTTGAVTNSPPGATTTGAVTNSPQPVGSTSSGGGGQGETSTSAGGNTTQSTGSAAPTKKAEEKLGDVEASITAKLQETFTPGLNDNTSAAFINKARECEDAICPVIERKFPTGAVKLCKVNRFVNGSIVVMMTVILDQNIASVPSNTTYENIMKQAILQANSTNGLGSLNLYGLTLTANVPTRAPTTPPAQEEEDDGLEGWQIALIVIFVLLLVCFIIFIVFLVVYKKKTEPAKEMDDRGCNIGATNPAMYGDAEDKV